MKIWEKINDTILRDETSIGRRGAVRIHVGQLDNCVSYFQREDAELELHMGFMESRHMRGYTVGRLEVFEGAGCACNVWAPSSWNTRMKMQDSKNTSVEVTSKSTVRVGLHQGSSLSPYLFDMILDMIGGISNNPLVFADYIGMYSSRSEHVEGNLDE